MPELLLLASLTNLIVTGYLVYRFFSFRKVIVAMNAAFIQAKVIRDEYARRESTFVTLSHELSAAVLAISRIAGGHVMTQDERIAYEERVAAVRARAASLPRRTSPCSAPLRPIHMTEEKKEVALV